MKVLELNWVNNQDYLINKDLILYVTKTTLDQSSTVTIVLQGEKTIPMRFTTIADGERLWELLKTELEDKDEEGESDGEANADELEPVPETSG